MDDDRMWEKSLDCKINFNIPYFYGKMHVEEFYHGDSPREAG